LGSYLQKKRWLLPFSKINLSKAYAIAAALMMVLGSVVIAYSITLFMASVSQPTSQAPIRVTQWSGYMAASDIQTRSPVVTGVSAYWRVPEVKLSENDTFSSAWVGIGGYGESTLIQTGTHHQCVNGKVGYYAWYELLPDDVVPIMSIHIRPGDAITASISLLNENTSTWLIEISDVSRGEHFEKTVFYNSSRLSADWIVERPNVNDTVSTLADFGSVGFSECTATIEGITGGVGNFSHAQLVMVDAQNVQLVNVSQLSDEGSSFTVSYLESANVGSQSSDLNVHIDWGLPEEFPAAGFSWQARRMLSGTTDW
jgi:hypothetical protein